MGHISKIINPMRYFDLPQERPTKAYKAYRNDYFDMKETKKVYHASHHNIITKLFFSAVSVVVEFCKNVYQVQVFNSKIRRENEEILLQNKKIEALNAKVREIRSSKIYRMKVYTKGLAKLGGFMLSTAALAYALSVALLSGQSYVCQAIVCNTSSTPYSLVTQLGNAFFNISKYAFLSVSVPTYGIFNLSKYVFTSLIPASYNQTKDFLETSDSFVNTKLIRPTSNAISQGFDKVNENIVNPLLVQTLGSAAWISGKVNYVANSVLSIFSHSEKVFTSQPASGDGQL